MKVKLVAPMEFQLAVQNPYILCFHHRDAFPKGTKQMTPIQYLPNRNPNGDFDLLAPWRMYYGNKIPGFPVHPHRGFETITVVTKGYADHFDSFGCYGRYGEGDVQWMTAGKGIQHSEMFPLLSEEQENPMELFQIWLNLPKKDKMVEPNYKMLWAEDIPTTVVDHEGAKATVRVLAGEFNGILSLDPTPHSWAFDRKNRVCILLLELEPHAKITLPKVSSTLNRSIYHYSQNQAEVDLEGQGLSEGMYAQLEGNEEITVQNTSRKVAKLLVLEGEPINEPVSAHGPFVMNSKQEILQAFEDFRKTEFGGWPWDAEDPVNDKDTPRFASFQEGEKEYPLS